MFDRSMLPPADWEFVLLADTHFMLGSDEVEFESRRQQTARIEHAIQLINALEPSFVVHLGDVVQAFPESDGFDRAMGAAQRQLDRLEAECYYVPGNHDVGDKPDPTMPTQPASPASVAAFHDRFGRSWEHWEHGGIDFVTIDSQLLNSTIDAADQQRTWLEAELRDRVDEPTFLFSHLPPFIHRPTDPGLGHYDTIDPPARDWLLDLIRDSPVTHVFSAHTHFQFRNRLGNTEFHTVPSPAFTRPGFSEVFSSCPPPERGRDDRPKLGFYLTRMRGTDPTFHFVRTGGETGSGRDTPADALLTLPTGARPSSRLGVSLLHPFVPTGTVPASFPASVQHEIHDDYPLLGCLELGASYLRLPVRDGRRSVHTRQHLELFRSRGGCVIGTTLEAADERTSGDRSIAPDLDDRSIEPLDEVELRIAGAVWPTEAITGLMEAIRASATVPIGLSVAVPGRSVPGKQHGRPRIGYRPAELEELGDRLEELDARVDRVVCRVRATDDPWDVIRSAPDPASLTRIGAVDWLLPSTGLEERSLVDHLSTALLAGATETASRLYLEPLRSLDRTMDVAPGVLDRRRNPTPAFHAARCLNTLLFPSDRRWRLRHDHHRPHGRLISVTQGDRSLVLALPRAAGEPFVFDWPSDLPQGTSGRRRRIELVSGTSTVEEATGGEAAVDRPTAFSTE